MARSFATLGLLPLLAQFGDSDVQAGERQLAHMVYFSLAEKTPDNREKLVAACLKHLTGHEGTVYFSVGTLAEELDRDVNDRQFDVALHVVFANAQAHDTYQTHPRHLQFIEENKHLWSQVRVFDSRLAAPPHDALPDSARGFAGMIRGEVVGRQGERIVVAVREVTNVWKTNQAQNSDSVVGKKVAVKSPSPEGPIARFLKSVKVGDNVQLDVANREGAELTILELTADQRQAVD